MAITREAIQNARLAAGLTTESAAKLVHCSRRAWECWESGERPLNQAAAELFLLKISGAYWKTPDPDFEGIVLIFADVDGRPTPIDSVSGSNFLGLFAKGPGQWVIKSLARDRFGRAREHPVTFNEVGNRHVLEACEKWERRRREDI